MAGIIRYSFERYENKYFLTPAQYAHIIEDIRPYVKEDDYGRYTICNIYCDSDDWSVVRAGTGAPDYKEKLRLRSYGTVGDDGSVFAEIKKKYAGIVYKRRISIGASETDAIFSDISASAVRRPNARSDISSVSIKPCRRCLSHTTARHTPGCTIRSCASPSIPAYGGGRASLIFARAITGKRSSATQGFSWR